MKVTPQVIPDILLIEPKVFADERGFFFFERSIAWNEPAVGVQWPIQGEPALSAKGQQASVLAQSECFA